MVQAVHGECLVVGVQALHIGKPDLQPALVKGVHWSLEESANISNRQWLRRRQERQFDAHHIGFPLLVRTEPFTVIGEQAPRCQHRVHVRRAIVPGSAISGGKILTAERLQRVFDRQGRRGFSVRLLHLPHRIKMVTELADQYGGWPFRVITDAAPYPTDVKLLPRGEQCLQKQVAVVLPAGTVARPVIHGHQVKIHRRSRARVVTVVHAQQAHPPKGDGAHGHQGCKIDLAGQEALIEAAFFQPFQQNFPHDAQGQFHVFHARTVAILEPLLCLSA